VKTLGDRIRELREQRDLSLRELAKAVETSAAFLSDVELGRRHPSEPVLKAIARKLETTLKDLQEHDRRPPLKEMQRIASANPAYGVLFRKVLEHDDPQAIIDYLDRRAGRKKS
jgi:transcriptional regulator with XRE-family HTH domain